MNKPKPPKHENSIPATPIRADRDWEQFQAKIQQDFDTIQQKHHPFSVTGPRVAFEFPITLDDDEWGAEP